MSVQIPEVPFVNDAVGPMPGFVAGLCGHHVARSEWRAGFLTCERCPVGDFEYVVAAVEHVTAVEPDGLTRERAAELLDFSFADRGELSDEDIELILARYEGGEPR